MSLDLTLLIKRESYQMATIMLDLNRNSNLWPKIQAVEEKWGRNVPEYFGTYLCREGQADDTEHYGNTQETPYGQPLLMVPIRKLVPLAVEPEIALDLENRAIWALLAAWPQNDWVALYWD